MGKGALIVVARLIIWCALSMKTEEKLPAKIFVQIKFFFQFDQLCICVGGSQSSRSWLLCSWKNHKYFEKFSILRDFYRFYPTALYLAIHGTLSPFLLFLVTWHHLVTRSVDIAKWWLVKMPLEIMIFMKSQIPNFTKKKSKELIMSLC